MAQAGCLFYLLSREGFEHASDDHDHRPPLVQHVLTRQNKDLNNAVEQDHRAVKQITRPINAWGQAIWSAMTVTAGIETMHMIKKGQMDCPVGQTMPAAPPVGRSR